MIVGFEVGDAAAGPAAAVGCVCRHGVADPNRRGRLGEGLEGGLQAAVERLSCNLGVLEGGLGYRGLREGAGAGTGNNDEGESTVHEVSPGCGLAYLSSSSM